MAVPKRKTSHSRKKLRQSHDALDMPGMSIDRKTKSVHRPHHVDLRTGFYRGKQVLFKDAEPDGAAGDTKKD
jgi:large subunit ribosomal protein L32